MTNNQQACSRQQVHSIVAELRQIVQRIQLPTPGFGGHPAGYSEMYTEEVANWVGSCMIFVRSLARNQGVRFSVAGIERPSAPGWLVRYLGACDAWLSGLESAVQSTVIEIGPEEASTSAGHANPWPLKQSVVLMDEFRRVLMATPLYVHLKEDDEWGADDGASVTVHWVRACAVYMESWASGMGFRSTIPIPELSDDGERVLGALDAWLSMLQQAFNEHLQPEYA